MTHQAQRRARAGFTLVELMVAGTVLAIITSFFLGSLSIQKRNYTINDQIIEIQQAARIIGDVLERDLRHAGFMAPPGGGICLIDNTTAPDILLLSDESAVNPTAENRSDLAARVPGEDNVTSNTQTLIIDDLIVEFVNPTPAYDTDGDGVNDSDFRVNAGVIVVDAANPGRGTACARVVDIPNATSIEINVLSQPLAAAGANPTDLVLVPARIYQVDGQGRLIRDGMIVANGVEDLQIAIFIDDDEDGDIDANEYRGDQAGPVLDPSAVDFSLAREVRASFVMRTRDADPEYTQGMVQSTANRVPVAGNDGFRRRVWVSTIMLRNIRPGPS